MIIRHIGCKNLVCLFNIYEQIKRMNENGSPNRTFFVHFFTVNRIKFEIITQTTIFSCHITANSNKYSCDNYQKICDNMPIF